ncbi:hypothetical protein N7510_006520 [Penicillium lagena]|uniref:uncharacterized protein n=1 Tax=Penicillium lagena TaxID=94218 RepID=UPI002540BBFC|nr:uncharacterized protein N7510_006520 [Penicillium lagena]KAJ5613326.1 hypothetical protein N7510_006520 [Penicillium lagena]
MADGITSVSQSADLQSPLSKPPSSWPSFSKSSSPKPPSSEPSFFQFPSQASSVIDPPIAPILAEIARDHPDQLWEAALAYHGCPRTEKPEEKTTRWTCWGLRQLVSRSMGMISIIVACLVVIAVLGMIFIYVPLNERSRMKEAEITLTELSSLNTTASASMPSDIADSAISKHKRRSPSSMTNLASPATSIPVPTSRTAVFNITATYTPIRSIPHGSQRLSSSSDIRTGLPPWSETTFRILPIPTGHTPSTTFATRPLRTTQLGMPTPGNTSLNTPMTINPISTQI